MLKLLKFLILIEEVMTFEIFLYIFSRNHYIVIGEGAVELSEIDSRETYNCTLQFVIDWIIRVVADRKVVRAN